MKKLWAVLLATLVLAGCGHTRLNYVGTPPVGMNRQQAVSIVEQVFYEDYSKTRPQSVVVTDEYILLSDGIVSSGSSFGSATDFGGGGAIAVGSSRVVTKEMGQRLYLRSIGDVGVFQNKVKKGRYVVVIRGVDGGQLRMLRMLSLENAERFSDAIAYLKANRTQP